MEWGGKRRGAGRPAGTGRFGVKTKAMRVPEEMSKRILDYIENQAYSIPLFSSKVRAGLPQAVDDHIEDYIDLNPYLIRNQQSTFLVRAAGDSMINANIMDGDLLIVDKKLEAKNGKIVVAAVRGELTVKRLQKTAHGFALLPENPDYPAIEINPDDEVEILGVVTRVIHEV